MNVFILHGEKDEAAAAELKAYMKSRGLIAETEDGTRGFRPLGATDVVVALWSKDSVFSTRRMLAEKRMLDAWAGQRLVLVKLDHSMPPVGLRDLPAVDATFVQSRQLVGWPGAERAAREAIRLAQAERDKPKEEAPPTPARSRSGPGSGSGGMGDDFLDGGLHSGALEKRGDFLGGSVERTASRSRAMRKSAGGGGAMIGFAALVLLAAGGASAWWLMQQPASPEGPVGDLLAKMFGVRWAETTLAICGAVGGLGVIILLVALFPKRKDEPVRRYSSAPAQASLDDIFEPAPALPAPVAAATPVAPDSVFVSYAHADESRVDPVIKAVETRGRKVWMDKGIHAGESWAGEIARAIKGAHGVMVMCSPAAFESDHIKREVYLADRYKKPMLPVFLEAAQMPEDFEYFFAGVQWLELFKLPEGERNDAIGKALAAV